MIKKQADFFIRLSLFINCLGSRVAKVIKVDKTPTILTAFAPDFYFDD